MARYLVGCSDLDAGRPANGVRHLMVAYHVLPELQSASLLVFAGLNWISRPGSPLIEVLLDVWAEFRQPDFDRTRVERTLLDVLEAPLENAVVGSALARKLWRLPVSTLRNQLRSSAERLIREPSGGLSSAPA